MTFVLKAPLSLNQPDAINKCNVQTGPTDTGGHRVPRCTCVTYGWCSNKNILTAQLALLLRAGLSLLDG